MAKKEKSENSGAWIIVLFGLAFLIPGILFGISTSKLALKTAAAKDWPTVNATIHTAKLTKRRGSESTMYEIESEYSYVWDGKDYRSDVISFDYSASSDRDEHDDILKELKRHKRSKRPMTAYINPDDPAQSILINKINWLSFSVKSTIAVAFTAIGVGILWLVYFAIGQSGRENKKQAAYPDQPWMWRDEWQNKTIKSSQKFGFIFLIFFTLIWCAISLPTTFVVLDEFLNEGNNLAIIGLATPIIGVGLIIYSFVYFKRWYHFKDNRFIIETFPAGLGYSLQGYFSMKADLPDETMFDVKLSSLRRRNSGKNNDHQEETILWQDSQTLPFTAGKFGADYRLPIYFEIPKNGEPTYCDETDQFSYFWRLHLHANLAGPDIDQFYEVPVYDPTEYTFDLPAETLSRRSPQGVYVDKGNWKNTGVVYNKSAASQHYYFPPARNIGNAVFFTVIALIFIGGTALLFHASAEDNIPIIFKLAFGLFALLFTHMALHSWFQKTSIETSRDGLSLEAGMFKLKQFDVSPSEIKKIKLGSTLSTGTEKYYNVTMRLVSGKKMTLAHNLRGKRDVESFIEKIKQDLKLDTL